MKKILLTCAALASLAAAAPASAQPFGDGDFGNFGRREARAERQIEWCRGISPWEARELRAELREIERLEWRMRHGGFNRFEFLELERRMDRLERHIRRECNDYNRHPGYRGGRFFDGGPF